MDVTVYYRLLPILCGPSKYLNISCILLGLTTFVAQTVKNLSAMQKTWVQSLNWEDFLQKGMATHSSILAWRIPRTEEPGRLQSMGSQRVGHDRVTNTFFGDHMQPKVFI